MEIKTKEITIKVKDSSPFYFGQKLYSIEKTNCQSFAVKCPVCEGTHTVNIKGYKLDCPYCTAGYRNNDMSSLYIYEPVIIEHIVSGVAVFGSIHKNGYGPKVLDKNLPTVEYKVSAKSRYGTVTYRTICESDIVSDKDSPPKFFLTKEEAEKALEEAVNVQKKELADFNERNGTVYEYPFE